MPVEIKKTHVSDKHLGIINAVLPYNSYSTPAVLGEDGIYLNGRTFTVLETNEAELVDYQRNGSNTITSLKADETSYVLDIEKYWGLQIDDLDVQDINTEVEQYQVAKQTNKVVAPYLDKIRFATLIGNAPKNVIPVADKEYDAVLDASIELDEISANEGDTSGDALFKGVVGELDGALVIKVPNKILNTGTNEVSAILTVENALVSPVQVDKFESGRNGAGKFGVYMQQLLYTGAFVLQASQPKIVTISKKVPTAKKSGTPVTPKA